MGWSRWPRGCLPFPLERTCGRWSRCSRFSRRLQLTWYVQIRSRRDTVRLANSPLSCSRFGAFLPSAQPSDSTDGCYTGIRRCTASELDSPTTQGTRLPLLDQACGRWRTGGLGAPLLLLSPDQFLLTPDSPLAGDHKLVRSSRRTARSWSFPLAGPLRLRSLASAFLASPPSLESPCVGHGPEAGLLLLSHPNSPDHSSRDPDLPLDVQRRLDCVRLANDKPFRSPVRLPQQLRRIPCGRPGRTAG